MPKNRDLIYKESKSNNWLAWIAVIIISVATIITLGKYANSNLELFNSEELKSCKARVITVSPEQKSEDELLINAGIEEYRIKFTCVLLDKENYGRRVSGTQTFSSMDAGSQLIKKVKPGDRIFVNRQYCGDSKYSWNFTGYYRFDKIIILGFIFASMLIIIGRVKGLNALISLTLTTVFVFWVFIPWILSGKNIYHGIILTAGFTIIMSLILIEGIGIKTLVTILGCTIGIILAAVIPMVMNRFLRLSGVLDEDSIFLILMNPEIEIDMLAIMNAGIIIGALGAVMDVAMDIASSLYEIRHHAPDIKFINLYRSGISISQDIMGTMTNTLVLAYIGSSLSSILLLISYTPTLAELINRELIIVELLQTLSGSIALLLTAPITSFLSAIFYTSEFLTAETRCVVR